MTEYTIKPNTAVTGISLHTNTTLRHSLEREARAGRHLGKMTVPHLSLFQPGVTRGVRSCVRREGMRVTHC
ncbi:hypothetical protein E2C01_036785 [Portunus trituberculatus]|uniref:Uncharacterized protein n=1 Tax=Portunus trituberculatus TaxID=210409 RepID=A0A5B7FDL5_PORTR|nr:hypothetical protein [Portunus trituberculatus]